MGAGTPARPGIATGCPPWGLNGGQSGAVGHTLIRYPGRSDLEPSLTPRQFAPPGTEMIYRTSGGGGWGDPLTRPAAQVLQDVTEGYVSTDAARTALWRGGRSADRDGG